MPDRAASARCIEDQELKELIQKIYTESDERYGSPRCSINVGNGSPRRLFMPYIADICSHIGSI